MPHWTEQQESRCLPAVFLAPAPSQERNRQYVGLIYAARSGAQDGSVQQRERKQARDTTMLSFLLSEGLDPVDVEVLYIIGAAFTPSIIGLVLCFVSLWLPDDGYVLSKPCDDQQDELQGAQDDWDDWRRAA